MRLERRELVRTVFIHQQRAETDRSSRPLNRPLVDGPAENRYTDLYQSVTEIPPKAANPVTTRMGVAMGWLVPATVVLRLWPPLPFNYTGHIGRYR